MTANPTGRHILVIKLGALGDVALAMPQIACLLDAFAGERVTLLTAPPYAALARVLPGLQVVAYPRRGFVAMSRLLAWLPGQQFDAVFDLQGSLRSRIMTRLTRAPLRYGIRRSTQTGQAPAPGAPALHAFERFNAVLTQAGVAAASPGYRLPVDAHTRTRVADWLRQHRLDDRPLVLLHAGGSPRWPSKRWPEAYYAELARMLEAQGCGVVWLGGAGEQALNRRLSRHAGFDATGVFSPVELVALAGQSGCVVCNDSGPMHVLALAGVPVYALFGPTDWRRSHALGQAQRVLSHRVACSPCHRPVCPPRFAHACLDRLTPNVVLERLQADGLF